MHEPTFRRVASVLHTLGALWPGRRRRRDASRLIQPWRDDSARTYPAAHLSPARLVAYLQAADAGTPQMQFELFSEMLQKWPRLAAVEATRRLALTGLDWELVVPPADGRARGARPPGHGGDGATPLAAPGLPSAAAAPAPGQKAPAPQQVADYCTQVLAGLDGLRTALDHLATAIGYGVAVCELVWRCGQLVDIVPVPHARLVADPQEPWRLRVRTADDPALGVALDEQPRKWLIHRPRATPGRMFDGGLLRASTLLFLAQHLSFKDWLLCAEIAGMPVRVAQFEPGTSDAEKQQLVKMLGALNTDAVAVCSKAVELKFIEAGRNGDRPYRPLQDYCNTEVTILWLGQHLTTDVRNSGSRAAAEIHDRVREDLLVDDIADEGATLRRDVLRPLVQARFGDAAAVPQFRRALIQSVDTKVLADTLAVAVNELGMAVPRQWVHQSLGIPQARSGEAVLAGRDRR